jgi:hypothetical protein
MTTKNLATAVLATALAAAVLGGTAPAFASSVTAADQPGVGVADPDSRDPKPEIEKPPIRAQYTCLGINCELRPYGSSTITPPGGSSSTIVSAGYSNAVVTRITYPCRIDYRNNSSHATWQGTNPWNATSVTLRDVWDTDYIAATGISVSDKPSGSVNRGSGRVEWETTHSNTWQVTHSWNSMRHSIDCGLGRITGINFQTHGTFQFGTASFRVSGYDGAGLIA